MIWTGIGWLGGMMFAVCAAPQVWKTYRERSAKGLSWGFLGLWCGGEIMTFAYILEQNMRVGELQTPLLANYIVNFAMVLMLIWGKIIFKE